MKNLGLCSCGNPAKHIYRGDHVCKPCKHILENERKIKWKKDNREKWLEGNKASTKKYREEHSERDEAYYWAKKLELMNMYGGKCAICGKTELTVLTIDHIFGGGKKERDELRDNNINYYCKLLREPVRSDLRCLCIECNWKSRVYGKDNLKWEEGKTRIENLITDRQRRMDERNARRGNSDWR
jgi:hypothetical protein